MPGGIGVISASLVGNIQEWAYQWSAVVMILFFVALIYLMWRMLKMMPRVKPQQIKPASNQSIAWKDIAGVDEAKGELQEIVEFLRDPKPFHELGAKVPKGILLHGPPGTGKTLLAKAVAHESGAQFFAQSAAAFVEMFAGLGAARIRRLFAIARCVSSSPRPGGTRQSTFRTAFEGITLSFSEALIIVGANVMPSIGSNIVAKRASAARRRATAPVGSPGSSPSARKNALGSAVSS